MDEEPLLPEECFVQGDELIAFVTNSLHEIYGKPETEVQLEKFRDRGAYIMKTALQRCGLWGTKGLMTRCRKNSLN